METKNNATNSKRKGDKILLAILAVAGVVIFSVYGLQMLKKSQNNTPDALYYVQVDVNNRTEALLPITADGEYTFHNIYNKGENIVKIQDGKFSMNHANCPDQVCVYQGELTPPTIVPIVCMPNVVYVTVLERSEIDWSNIRQEIVPEALADDYAAYQASK